MTICSPRQQHHSIAAAIILLFFHLICFFLVVSSSTNHHKIKCLFADAYPQQQQQRARLRSSTNNYNTNSHTANSRRQQHPLTGPPNNKKKNALSSASSSSQQEDDDNDDKDNNTIEEGEDDGDGNCKANLNDDSNHSGNIVTANDVIDHSDDDFSEDENEEEDSLDEEEEFLPEEEEVIQEDEDEEDLLYYDFYDDESNHDPNGGEDTSSEAMIVCGVDGTVYTLDAWTGQLRGLFPSGNALVGSSLSMTHQPSYDHDENSHNNMEQDSPSSFVTTERIVPGLDGNLYSLTQIQTTEGGQNLPFQQQQQRLHPPKLDMLPIRIEDVLQSPISTCRSPTTNSHISFGQEEETCGIVMGQRTTKVFALNVKTGTVQWMQHAAGKDGGFSTHNLFNKNKKTEENDPVVLLQREDYVVRHVDMETGEETWKVQLGKFSAFDFTKHSSSKATTSKDVSVSTLKQQQQKTSHATSNVDNDCQSPPPNSIQSRIPNIPNQRIKKKQQAYGPTNINSNKRCGNANKNQNPLFPTDHHESVDSSMFVQPMPSIAFRMDGSSFVGLDSATGEVLWKRKIDSIVASAYGVSSTGKWTPLSVIEDYIDPESEPQEEFVNDKDIFTHEPAMTCSSSYLSLDLNPSSSSSTNETPTILQIPLLSSASSISSKPNEVAASPYYDSENQSDEVETIDTDSSPLAIIHDPSDMNHHQQAQAQQHNSGTDVIARVGKHSSSFFVVSTIPPLVGSSGTKDDNHKNSNDRNSIIFSRPSTSPHFLDTIKKKEDHNDNNNDPLLMMQHEHVEDHKSNDNNLGSTIPSLDISFDGNPLPLNQLMKKAGVDMSDPKSVTAYLNHLALKNKMNIGEINGGLFLTWQMVAMLVSILVGMIFCGHVFYQKQKRKWILESTPINLPISVPDLDQNNKIYGNGGGLFSQQVKSKNNINSLLNQSPSALSLPTKGDFPPPLLLEQTAVSTNEEKTESVRQTDFSRKSPVLRSMSLPQLNNYNQSGSSSGESERLQSNGEVEFTESNESQDSIQNTNDQSLIDQNLPMFDSSGFFDMKSGGNNILSDANTNIPQLQPTTTANSHNQTTSITPTVNNPSHNAVELPSIKKGLSLNPSSEKKISFLETVCNIDGIPLVRYSRYRSEFHEISRLGRGGFGAVFKCSNKLDGRQYAIKKVTIKVSYDNEDVNVPNLTKKFSQKLQRVLREVKILAMLDHKNVVSYHTAWLELDEDEDFQENGTVMGSEDSSSLLNATSKMARGFSSELLAGTGTQFDAASVFSEKDSRTSNGENQYLMQLSKPRKQGFQMNSIKKNAATNALYNNPLGGWNNFYEPTSSLEESSWSGKKKNSSRRIETLGNKELNVSSSSLASEEDLGFNWERSNSGQFNSLGLQRRDDLSTINDSSSSSCSESDDESFSSRSDSQWSDADTYGHGNKSKDKKLWAALINDNEYAAEEKMPDISDQSFYDKPKQETPSSPQSCNDKLQAEKLLVRNRRHILYMQMQLCSQQTLSDFLNKTSERLRSSNKSSRTTEDETTSNDSAIDIPFALRMFSQIAQGVKHVHQQGLIHRDLKPSNCFIDETGTVKIGDFGLSRESATAGLEETGDITDQLIDDEDTNNNCLGRGQDNTAGVGTRSYASPEQMNGSDYVASTDVYSLGIILFELCYLMSTGMERHLVFRGIRRRSFPDQWHNTVAKNFPSLHELVMIMLSPNPSERPSSAAVANHIDTLLSEYTVLSLDHTKRQDSSVLLRVEADDNEGILQRTIKMIKEADPKIIILQYGLRGQESKAIMEFALAFCPTRDGTSEEKSLSEQIHFETVTNIFKKLDNCKEIIGARQVSEKHMSRQASIGSSSHSANYHI